MATVKTGMLTKSPEWWRHLRGMKRVFWKAERMAAKREIRVEGSAYLKHGANDGRSADQA